MQTPRWLTSALRLAGLYNLLWGALVVFFPLAFFRWADLPLPNYPEIWQCLGMVVGVYGIGYWIAARDPARHWPIIAVGLLGKVLGPIGMMWALWRGTLPPVMAWICMFNDVIWWIPFSAALWYAVRINTAPSTAEDEALQQLVTELRDQEGRTLDELSQQQPVLVTFLRHAGCTFCREALADLSRDRKAIESRGMSLAVVHMSDEEAGAALCAAYQLEDVPRFSDPECRLYRAFGLARGRFMQVLSPRVWWRGFQTAIIARHGFGKLQGDGLQMPGVFVLDRGRVVAAYRHATAADRPDYTQIAQCGIEPAAH